MFHSCQCRSFQSSIVATALPLTTGGAATKCERRAARTPNKRETKFLFISGCMICLKTAMFHAQSHIASLTHNICFTTKALNITGCTPGYANFQCAQLCLYIGWEPRTAAQPYTYPKRRADALECNYQPSPRNSKHELLVLQLRIKDYTHTFNALNFVCTSGGGHAQQHNVIMV